MYAQLTNADLKTRHTFGVEARAARIIETDDSASLLDQLINSDIRMSDLLIMGEGSNLLFSRDYPGTLLHPVNKKMNLIGSDQESVIIEAEAGCHWDDLVAWTVEQGWFGLENLSGIPGSVGASPVQNIGAYGVEVAMFILEVQVVDLRTHKIFWINQQDCRFGYRDSTFKDPDHANWLVWKVRFKLFTTPTLNLSYQALAQQLQGKKAISAEQIREAVLSIRASKLPDPAILGNAGSFFKNPVVPKTLADELRLEFQNMPSYPVEQTDLIKLSAGWLIEQAGLKGYRQNEVGMYEKQALILVNHGKATGPELVSLAEMVQSRVLQKFGVNLEPEVRII